MRTSRQMFSLIISCVMVCAAVAAAAQEEPVAPVPRDPLRESVARMAPLARAVLVELVEPVEPGELVPPSVRRPGSS